MTTDEWVRSLNKLAFEIDVQAASMHPSAWREQLGPLFEKFRKLAKYHPSDEPPEQETIEQPGQARQLSSLEEAKEGQT